MAKSQKRKFPRPKVRNVPLDLVTDFLEKKGCQVMKIERPWRHVIAVVRKNHRNLFFKMATTLKTGKMTENEFNWNRLTGSKLSAEAPFLVPRGIEHGFFQDRLFFFISDYFGSQTLADKYPPRVKQLSQWLPQIARAAYLIGQIECRPKDKKKPKTIGECLINSALEWASQTKVNLQPLVSIIKNSRQKAERVWAHGDFVPWHMYQLKEGRFGLVDAEHGGCGLKYYDLAYFYTRVRQSLGEKELAKSFLIEFRGLLSLEDKANFWRDLKPILAQRLIGEYWELKTGSKEKRNLEFEKREEFKQDLIEDKIL